MEESIKIQEEFENLIEQLERLKNINELTSANTESSQQVIKQIDKFVLSTNEFKKKIEEDLSLKSQSIDKLIIHLEKSIDSIEKQSQSLSIAINSKLDSLIPSLLAVKNTVDNNHIAITKILNSFSEATLKHFKNQVSQTEKSRETLHTQINLLKDQNSELKKAIATNRIIQIVGFVVIVVGLIYLIVKYL